METVDSYGKWKVSVADTKSVHCDEVVSQQGAQRDATMLKTQNTNSYEETQQHRTYKIVNYFRDKVHKLQKFILIHLRVLFFLMNFFSRVFSCTFVSFLHEVVKFFW